MYVTISTDDVIEFHKGIPSYKKMKEHLNGGWLEAISVNQSDLRATMYIDEEGKLNNLPVNIYASYISAPNLLPGDVIVGNVILLGPPDGSGKDTSLNEDWRTYLMQVVSDINFIRKVFK